ncbi:MULTISPECIES: hypothetical protein [Streptomyces]|uniref:hypothetical protein n=1 Tax=Streptomyces TaxID=1883 RepID=UPI00345B7A2C
MSTVPPHSRWLFSHMAAVVHACGAGTTAVGLPAVPVPVRPVQPFRRSPHDGAGSVVTAVRRPAADDASR